MGPVAEHVHRGSALFHRADAEKEHDPVRLGIFAQLAREPAHKTPDPIAVAGETGHKHVAGQAGEGFPPLVDLFAHEMGDGPQQAVAFLQAEHFVDALEARHVETHDMTGTVALADQQVGLFKKGLHVVRAGSGDRIQP